MDFDIVAINKKHGIELDPSVLEKLTPIPDNIPDWKKNIVKTKNEKLIEGLIQEAIANKDPYAGVPAWKKDILKKRDNEKEEMIRRKSEEEKVKLEIENRFQSKPEWKKELIIRRISKNDD